MECDYDKKVTQTQEFETLRVCRKHARRNTPHPAIMDATTTKETAIEVCKILDSLTALSVDMACQDDVPGHQMMLSAQKVRSSCKAITEAVVALKRILLITEANGGGLIPPAVTAQLERAQEKRT